jgi:hypothetical protein
MQQMPNAVVIVVIPAVSHSYLIHGISVLHQATSCVNLGVSISYNLAFNYHIINIVSRACQRTSILYRGVASVIVMTF